MGNCKWLVGIFRGGGKYTHREVELLLFLLLQSCIDCRYEINSVSWILSIGLEVRRQVASSLFIFAVLCGSDPLISPV